MLANTLVPYFALWGLMIWSIRVSYWITLGLSVLAGGFLIRTFIIFHDCGHGSFFKSKKANDVVGSITGFLNFTPYYRWKHDHAIHHATAGGPRPARRRRCVHDDCPGISRFAVVDEDRLPHHAQSVFSIWCCPSCSLPPDPEDPCAQAGKRERASIWWTNLALVVEIVLLSWLLGWKTFLMIQLPVIWISSTIGIWLFYVQHNFLPSYWERHENWEFAEAGLQGSSFYKLPVLLQWLSGNIGFHHIHHLSPKIPNYNLPRCLDENALFQIQPLTIRSSLKSLSLRLYDEERRLMVGWEGLKFYKTQKANAANT